MTIPKNSITINRRAVLTATAALPALALPAAALAPVSLDELLLRSVAEIDKALHMHASGLGADHWSFHVLCPRKVGMAATGDVTIIQDFRGESERIVETCSIVGGQVFRRDWLAGDA